MRRKFFQFNKVIEQKCLSLSNPRTNLHPRIQISSGFLFVLFLCEFSFLLVPAVDWSARRRLLREKWPIRKAEGLCSEVGGISQIGLEGALCLLGRFGL